MLTGLHEIVACQLLSVEKTESVRGQDNIKITYVLAGAMYPALQFVIQIAVQAGTMCFNYLKCLWFRKAFFTKRGIEITYKHCQRLL